MTRDDQAAGPKFNDGHPPGGGRDPGVQSRPRSRRPGAKPATRCGKSFVDDHRARRRVVEQQHDLSKQTVPASKVEHTPAAKEPPYATSHLPRFVQLFTWQAAGKADRTR